LVRLSFGPWNILAVRSYSNALAGRIALVPFRASEPTGEEDLAALTALTHQPA
jgi:hypothetical protein